ncbi:MAG TPA: bifunctional DNA primase/polymerase [Candidatus Bathyarchaeia archaeon]|nr:bifunctional DNA primase/polymerase [Candidatus Bathyarchaeia archaeon]
MAEAELCSKPRRASDSDLYKEESVGCVCGSVSGNLHIVDYDLYKLLESREIALQWRKENITLLRSLKTLVTYTPRGGFHVWFRTKQSGLHTNKIARAVQAIQWDIDVVRGDGGLVVVPPSKLEDGRYWFMDDSKIDDKED